MTMDEIRAVFVAARADEATLFASNYVEAAAEAGAEFDQALTQHNLEIQRPAWQRGMDDLAYHLTHRTQQDSIFPTSPYLHA